MSDTVLVGTDAIIFGAVLIGFFILRLVIATVFFYFILPEGDRCPVCDTPTLRVASKGWNTLLPWFRTSWCYACGWDGMLRHGPVSSPVSPHPDAPLPGSARHDTGEREKLRRPKH
jgi:hypothetical protein